MTADDEHALALLRRSRVAPEAVQLGPRLTARLRRLSSHTRSAYQTDLDRFAEWAGGAPTDVVLQRYVSLSKAHAEEVADEYLAHMVELRLAPATINRRLSALRSIVTIARRATICTWDLEIEGVKARAYRDTKGPGLEVIRTVLRSALADESPRGCRDYAVLMWLGVLALRRIELQRMTLGDLRHDDEGWTIMVQGKGYHDTSPIPLEPGCHEAMQRWLAHRGTTPGALFSSLSHRHLSSPRPLDLSSFNRIVSERAVEAGYPGAKLPDGRSITPHGFRHTAITEIVRKCGLMQAQELARHKDPRTTMNYLDNLGETVRASQGELAHLLEDE
jgi:integrase/recombinase XerC